MAAYTYPLSLAQFFNTIRLESCLFRPLWYQAGSDTGGGEDIVVDMAPPRWGASIRTVEMELDQYNDFMARVEILAEGEGSFLAYDYTKQYPKADPGGTLLGAPSPGVEIHSVSGALGLRLKNLPSGYILTLGDCLALYDGSSYRRHRIVETVTADGSGITPLFEVRPKLSALTVADIAVDLIKPVAEMAFVRGSLDVQDGNSTITRVVTAQWRQRFHG